MTFFSASDISRRSAWSARVATAEKTVNGRSHLSRLQTWLAISCRWSPYESQRFGQASAPVNSFPASSLRNEPYVESVPIPEYHSAPTSAYEAFQDMKFGVRIHWGMYSIWHRGPESWPFPEMLFEDRDRYNQLHKTWNPTLSMLPRGWTSSRKAE
jgi:hypothetical protein